MSVQWFPGHMNAARRKAAETMAVTDLVIEVLDARIPQASCNPMVEELRNFRQRPCLKILNKSDLADPAITRQWLDYFNSQKNVRAIALNSHKPADVAKVTGQCQASAPHRNDPTKPLRMMIMGIPNVGKSTLMNALLKRRVAKVGDVPAVTKSQQRLYLNKSMVLTDTPGMLWPKIAYPSDGMMLAACHAVGVNAVIEEEVATFLAALLLDRYPEQLSKRYGLKLEGMDEVDVLEGVAQRRGLRIRGGGLDYEKAAHVLLHDFRSGALGNISLESPASRADMMAREEALAEEARQAAAEDE